MANFLLAADAGLMIIPAINKASVCVCVCVSLHFDGECGGYFQFLILQVFMSSESNS